MMSTRGVGSEDFTEASTGASLGSRRVDRRSGGRLEHVLDAVARLGRTLDVASVSYTHLTLPTNREV